MRLQVEGQKSRIEKEMSDSDILGEEMENDFSERFGRKGCSVYA